MSPSGLRRTGSFVVGASAGAVASFPAFLAGGAASAGTLARSTLSPSIPIPAPTPTIPQRFMKSLRDGTRADATPRRCALSSSFPVGFARFRDVGRAATTFDGPLPAAWHKYAAIPPVSPAVPPSAGRRRRTSAMARASLLFAPLAVALAACGPATPSAHAPDGARLETPWAGRLADLFADAIDPAAVGLAMLPASPRSDPYLRDRTQSADVITRARVSTATSDHVGEQVHYHLTLVPFDAPMGVHEAAEHYELQIAPGSPAYGIAKAMEGRLVGRSFIAFLRTFRGQDEPVLHWHLAPDLPETAAAVREASALSEFMRQ